MSAPDTVRTDRVRAFAAWLNTVPHPHWGQPGFEAFADLTQAERLEAVQILERQADARHAHADRLEAEMERRIEARRAPSDSQEKGSPPAGTEGLCNAVGAIAGPSYKREGRPGKHNLAPVAYRAPTGRVWRYTGKRGRVLAMLATMPGGVTQWDTLPWHTRLGGTIHALREDGLAIETAREGEYRHARYRLRTPGQLDKGAEA